jgi:hypothetical protein
MWTLSPKQNFSVYLECNYQTESVLHQRQGILKNEKPMFPSSKHFTPLSFFFSFLVIPYGSPWKIMPCIMQDYTFWGDYLIWECPTPMPFIIQAFSLMTCCLWAFVDPPLNSRKWGHATFVCSECPQIMWVFQFDTQYLVMHTNKKSFWRFVMNQKDDDIHGGAHYV